MSPKTNNLELNQNIAASSEEVEIDLLELFFFLLGKIFWLIGGFMIGAVIALLFTKFLITPLYQATAKVYMVSASSDSIVDLTDLNIGTSLSADYEELLKIRPIYEEIIDELGLDYTYDELRDMTAIGTINKTRLIGITVTSPDPEEACDVANAVAGKAVSYIPELMEVSAPHIAEKAIVPEKKSSPSLAKNTVIGALLGFILIAGIFVVQYLLDDTFKSAEDVEKVFGVMPLTVIPEGEIEGISDKVEQEIRQQKKKERKAKAKAKKKENQKGEA